MPRSEFWYVPVVQWIEYRIPVPTIRVRLPTGIQIFQATTPCISSNHCNETLDTVDTLHSRTANQSEKLLLAREGRFNPGPGTCRQIHGYRQTLQFPERNIIPSVSAQSDYRPRAGGITSRSIWRYDKKLLTLRRKSNAAFTSPLLRMLEWWNGRHEGLKILWSLRLCGFESRFEHHN